MTEGEYREFLSSLFELYVHPRIGLIRGRNFPHQRDDYSFYIDRATRSVRLLRFIESNCYDESDIYDTFTLTRLHRVVGDIESSFGFSQRIVNDAGFLDSFEVNIAKIADGLETVHLPNADEDIIQEMGSANPAAELHSLVYLAKASFDKFSRNREHRGLREELQYVGEKLKEAKDGFEEISEGKKGKED